MGKVVEHRRAFDLHSELPGHPLRRVVVRSDQRDQPPEAQVAEGVVPDRGGRLGGDPLPPPGSGHVPGDLHLGDALDELDGQPQVPQEGPPSRFQDGLAHMWAIS